MNVVEEKAVWRAIYCVALGLLLSGASGWAQKGAYTAKFRVSPPAPTAPNPFSRSTPNPSPAPFGTPTPQRFNASPFPNASRNLGVFIRSRIISPRHHARSTAGPTYIYVPYVPYPNVYLYYPYDYDLQGIDPAPSQPDGFSNQDLPLGVKPAGNGKKEQASGTSDVTFQSTPAGADIYVDGNFVGDTPFAMSLAPGLHTISIQQWGYQAWQRVLIIAAGGKITIDATLAED